MLGLGPEQRTKTSNDGLAKMIGVPPARYEKKISSYGDELPTSTAEGCSYEN